MEIIKAGFSIQNNIRPWHYKKMCGLLLVSLICLSLLGCKSHRSALAATALDREQTYAISQDTDTSLRRMIAPRVEAFDNQSGFHVLRTGSEAFTLRLALIENAEKTIDLQYYAIHDDVTANLLVYALLRAAERGVRIRFIIDAITLGPISNTFQVLNRHENFQIRIFNPWVTMRQDFFSRMLTRFTDLNRMNRRMHNKAMIADNQLAIMGGRNLGDEYFESFTNNVFKDVDILAAGPIVADISDSFDQYWNDKNAVDLRNIEDPRIDLARAKTTFDELHAHWQETLNSEDSRGLIDYNLTRNFENNQLAKHWSDATLNADDPQKINSRSRDNPEEKSRTISRLNQLLADAKDEFIIINPYFVPTVDGVNWLTGLQESGINVRILTNSLASTDVVAVHTGYERYRKDLLQAGIELYEMKPPFGEQPEQRLIGIDTPAQASLHSKVFIIDRDSAMVGSFNMDPRSVYLNTEAMLSIYSPAIAEELAEMFEDVINENSYALKLDQYNRLRWHTYNEDGEEVIYYSEPEAGILRRLQALLISFLPIEKHL